MAPELVKALNTNKTSFAYNSYRSDVYSLGLCLLFLTTFKIFTVQEVLNSCSSRRAYEKLLSKLFKEMKRNYSKILIKVLKLMLVQDSFKRLDFA